MSFPPWSQRKRRNCHIGPIYKTHKRIYKLINELKIIYYNGFDIIKQPIHFDFDNK